MNFTHTDLEDVKSKNKDRQIFYFPLFIKQNCQANTSGLFSYTSGQFPYFSYSLTSFYCGFEDIRASAMKTSTCKYLAEIIYLLK